MGFWITPEGVAVPVVRHENTAQSRGWGGKQQALEAGYVRVATRQRNLLFEANRPPTAVQRATMVAIAVRYPWDSGVIEVPGSEPGVFGDADGLRQALAEKFPEPSESRAERERRAGKR
jgi:hypothetical protein